ncbi:MAG: VanW family protein [Filifactoraceae bacterium]
MKKSFKRSASAIICSGLIVIGGISYGEEVKPSVYIEQSPMIYTAETGYPYISLEGRDMLPLAATLSSLGVAISYDGATKTITAVNNDKTVIIPLGKKYIELEGKKLVLEERTRIKDGKAYGHITPIVQALRMTALWDDQLKSIMLSTTPTYELLNLVDLVSPEDEKVEVVEKPVAIKDEAVDNNYYSQFLGTTKTLFNANVKNRSINIKVATEAINGTVIEPGATFSYNTIVGSRSIERGYVASTVISGGEYTAGVGGGVCQVSSTLFSSALDANMVIVERHPHSLKQVYIQAGKDATVYYGSADLQFKNPYDYPVTIASSYDNKGVITISIKGPKEIIKPNVRLKVVSDKSGAYKLIRTVNGIENYSTYSKYKK